MQYNRLTSDSTLALSRLTIPPHHLSPNFNDDVVGKTVNCSLLFLGLSMVKTDIIVIVQCRYIARTCHPDLNYSKITRIIKDASEELSKMINNAHECMPGVL